MSPICFRREQVDLRRHKRTAGFFIAFCLGFDEMLAAGYRCNVTGQLGFHRDPRENPRADQRGWEDLSIWVRHPYATLIGEDLLLCEHGSCFQANQQTLRYCCCDFPTRTTRQGTRQRLSALLVHEKFA